MIPSNKYTLTITIDDLSRSIVVPINSFFSGLQEDWAHKQQCIRISLTAIDVDITTAMERLATVVTQVYRGK